MLILSRRPGQRIVIGDGIEVSILEVSDNRVKLGITAPAELRVDREEVHQRRVREQLGEWKERDQ